LMRRLRAGPAALVDLARLLGVSRQAIRKFVASLEERGYVTVERDTADGRRCLVTLTPAGEAYARAVRDVARALNHDVARQIDEGALAVTLEVLTTLAAIYDIEA